MQFTIASVIALFAASSLAAPAGNYAINQARISLSNDNSGANGNALVSIDGVNRSLINVFADTRAVQNGQILISSVMLTEGSAFNPTCKFFTPAGVEVSSATLTATRTFAKLGNHPDMLQLVDWTAFTVTCS